MKYFVISNGLRGCYMPDGAYIVQVSTRRELKQQLEWEARELRDAGFVGASKRNIARLAAAIWRDAGKAKKTYLDFVCPLQPSHAARGDYCYGLFVSHSTRADYLDYLKDCGE